MTQPRSRPPAQHATRDCARLGLRARRASSQVLSRLTSTIAYGSPARKCPAAWRAASRQRRSSQPLPGGLVWSVMSIVAVSPHLDDAALSASVALGQGGATVATVFTALPRADQPITWWDRLTGAASSLERQRERLAEDEQAMRLLSARGVHLDEPEALYRDGDPDLDRAVERLTELMKAADEVWLPSAIGGHRDHAFAREAGLRAAAATGHPEVMLYADFPYLIAYGWPSWVSGRPASVYLDAAYWLADQIDSAGLDARSLTPAVTRLDPAQQAKKAEIIAAYRSQADALGLAPRDLAADPAKLEFELAWRMPLTPGKRLDAAGLMGRLPDGRG